MMTVINVECKSFVSGRVVFEGKERESKLGKHYEVFKAVLVLFCQMHSGSAVEVE